MAGGMGVALGLETIKSGSYDIYNKYYLFPAEFTDIIDSILINDKRGLVGKEIVLANNYNIPGSGKHYFYWKNNSWFHYIVFDKKIYDNSLPEYICYISPFQTKTFINFLQQLFISMNGSVRVISIDTSLQNPILMCLTKNCEKPRKHQEIILNQIIKHYKCKNNTKKNTKIMITGEKGYGKTYIARLLKKKMEFEYNTFCHLYDDFNPSSVGCNVSRLILRNANVKTNIIIIMNEIDVIYEKVISNENINRHDTRLLHTQDKSTFNNMLDVISDTKHVITIYTTEKTPQQLYKKEDFRSFMRKGRVDTFINIKKNKDNFECENIKHEDLNIINV
jgi:hypothetical protein